MKKTLVIFIVAACMLGCQEKSSTQDSGKVTTETVTPFRESGAVSASSSARSAFIPSAPDLKAFLAVFPEIVSFPFVIEDAPAIGMPSLAKSDRALDRDLAARIMNWDPPPDQWRPAHWHRDLPPDADSSPASDGGGSAEEMPLGDSDYEGEWEHGFYAIGRIMQSKFVVLIAAYSEAFSYAYSDPWVRENYEYRLVTIAPDGRFIDSIVLHARLVETNHPGAGSGDEPAESSEGSSAVLASDFSLTAGSRQRRIDETGVIR